MWLVLKMETMVVNIKYSRW